MWNDLLSAYLSTVYFANVTNVTRYVTNEWDTWDIVMDKGFI